MKKLTIFILSWIVIPISAQKLYVYPANVTAPLGSYQTVTAIVNGVNNKTVTWTASGGKIVGTNPCVANEPCTIALYSGTVGTFHLTAASNANHAVTATSTITFAASPKPRTDHPRFLVTSSMLPSLQAKGVSSNPMYQGMATLAENYYSADSSIWKFSNWSGSACTGGSAPSSDQSANYRENDAWWMTLVSMLSSSSATRNKYGCAARDVFMTNIGYVLDGKLNLGKGNRWSDGSESFAFTADFLMGGGYLSDSDKTTVRAYLARLAHEEINNRDNGDQAVIGNYNSPAQFEQSNDLAASGIRAMGNNYSQSRILLLMAVAFTFNDNPTDDPPLSNTCSATRYQVCPDGTAGSLHAYWTYDAGGMLYKDWANMEDPGVVQSAYNTAFGNMRSTPMCNTHWGTPISCLGGGRGGESNEGTFYGYSVARLRWTLNALHTAGVDDPVLYGPQISLVTSSYWDLHYLADLTLLTGLSGTPSERSRWTFLTDGDSLNYYTYPSIYVSDAATLAFNSYNGRTDSSNALEWLTLNTAYGLARGTTGGCTQKCGYNAELSRSEAADTALDAFIALPAADPVTHNPPSDPRPSLPTDWYNASNQHIVTRDNGWGSDANTIFSYYCTNTEIDHEHEYCGGFSLYSNGEYITKGRMEFNNYHDAISAAPEQNIAGYINTPTSTACATSECKFYGAAQFGGQWYHGYQAGLISLEHSELPGYVAAIANSTNGYNASGGDYGSYNGITAASRSLIYLRGSNQVIYYDRGASGSHAWGKANYLVATGAPTFTGNTASWLTRSKKQRAYWTTLVPTGSVPVLDQTYNDADSAYDWEIYGRMKVDAGKSTSAQFLSVLEWGKSSLQRTSTTLVRSTAGQRFEGALVGSSVVMFMHDWPAAFTTVTYPASGATTHYISDLAPNATYSISAAGSPQTATTDNAGMLMFKAAGSGDVTIAKSGSR